MGQVEGCPQPNEDITSFTDIFTILKIVEDLEFSPKPQRCQIFTAFFDPWEFGEDAASSQKSLDSHKM